MCLYNVARLPDSVCIQTVWLLPGLVITCRLRCAECLLPAQCETADKESKKKHPEIFLVSLWIKPEFAKNR